MFHPVEPSNIQFKQMHLSKLKSVTEHLFSKHVTLVLSQNTDTIVNFMIKLPVDLSEVPPYIIKVRKISTLYVSIRDVCVQIFLFAMNCQAPLW